VWAWGFRSQGTDVGYQQRMRAVGAEMLLKTGYLEPGSNRKYMFTKKKKGLFGVKSRESLSEFE
jgi:hypothetical protein